MKKKPPKKKPRVRRKAPPVEKRAEQLAQACFQAPFKKEWTEEPVRE